MSSKSDSQSLLVGHLSPQGAFYAFSTGALIGLGYAMMTEEDLDLTKPKVAKRLGFRAMGTGVFSLGWYFWSPHWLRAVWVTEK